MTSVLRRLISPEDYNKIISNPYFWLTLLLVLVIAAVYYLNLMVIDRSWEWFWHLSLFEFSHDINGSLMYIPFILAAILLGVRGLLIIWGTAMLLMLPVIINYTPDPQSVFTNIIFMTAPMLIIGYISLQIKWRDQERKIITEREKEKQYYLSRILKAQDDERKRIAQELHDDTTQILLVVATHVQSIISDKYFKPGSEPAERMEWIKKTILHLSDDIRRISVELRPSILDNMEFIPALESLVESLEQNYGIDSVFEVSGNERDIPKDYQISLIRVVQEALTNIRRHSKATKASVRLHFYEKEILLTIEDNGRGFTEDDKARSLTDTKKLGIIGMRERIGSLGGTFDIHSETGKGTYIFIKLSQK